MRTRLVIFFLLIILSVYFQLVIRSAQVQSFQKLQFYINGSFFLLIDSILALFATIVSYNFARQKFASNKYRHVIIYIISFIIFIILATGWQLLVELVIFKNPFYLYRYVADFFLRSIFHAVIAVSFITYKLLKEQQQTRELLNKTKKALTESKLQLLQQQLSPHFLFNNLNALSAMIESTNEAAHKYLFHLSRIYRYLIKGSTNDIVSVSEEKAFIIDYIYLLKQRFGDAYVFTINDHCTINTNMLPAYCLQELIINAMKHNETMSHDPLHIEINFYNKSVVIKNDLRLKSEQLASLQTGLHNLRERYKLITDDTVDINKTNTHFIVTLPTIPLL